MGYFTPGEIFENMLQLKRFGLYFETILNMGSRFCNFWLLSYRNNDISYRHAPRENFEMIGAIWSVLMYYFYQI